MRGPRPGDIGRRRFCAGAAAASLTALAGPGRASGEDIRFFRIGTGATSGTYFSVGSMVATAISNPPGSRSCDVGGSCGVPGLIAVAQSTQGSIQNIEEVATGLLESGLAQADVVYWAYHGTGLFQDRGARPNLRAIANIFTATVHVVVRADRGISDIADLRGRRISLGDAGSGTPMVAKDILAAYEIAEGDFEPFNHKPGPAADLLESGGLDAFFVIGAVPVSAISALVERVPIRLLEIAGTAGEEIRTFYPFLADAAIRGGAYTNVGHTVSAGISTQWIISDESDEDFVYALTEALWHEKSRSLFEKGHPEGKNILLERALNGIAIPVHPGAARYYAEHDIRK